MKKKRKKLHRSNEGFTLVEIIVTMLISSIVTMAVAGFLSMGVQYYRRTNAETALQTESQVAELFLTELLQESQDYKVLDSTKYPAGVTCALEVKREDMFYLTVKTGSTLLFAKLDDPAAADDAKINEVLGKGMEKAFLAKHVASFSVSPLERKDAFSLNNGLVNLGLGFSVDGKTYVGDATVALRNAVRN